jgi:hypothetical protein
MDEEIYAAVIRRLAETDHGWGMPYEFAGLYVLDHAVPGVENPLTDFSHSTGEQTFDKLVTAALRERLKDLPALTFVKSFMDVYDSSRSGPNQVCGGGGFIALGPVDGDEHTAVVGALFYGGHLWARWIRYHLARVEDTWSIAGSELLAVS